MNIKISDLPNIFAKDLSDEACIPIVNNDITYNISILELRRAMSIWWSLWYWICDEYTDIKMRMYYEENRCKNDED